MWYIGQEIVCIKTHSQRIVKKGETYTISNIAKPCCNIVLDVGIRANTKFSKCTCNKIYNSEEIFFFHEGLFSPIEYNQQAINELLENTQIITK